MKTNIEYILCATIKVEFEGKSTLILGYRHNNCFELGKLTEIPREVISNSIQGFLTSKNKFVTRKEASLIAFEAGQITEKIEILTSEDLY